MKLHRNFSSNLSIALKKNSVVIYYIFLNGIKNVCHIVSRQSDDLASIFQDQAVLYEIVQSTLFLVYRASVFKFLKQTRIIFFDPFQQRGEELFTQMGFFLVNFGLSINSSYRVLIGITRKHVQLRIWNFKKVFKLQFLYAVIEVQRFVNIEIISVVFAHILEYFSSLFREIC